MPLLKTIALIPQHGNLFALGAGLLLFVVFAEFLVGPRPRRRFDTGDTEIDKELYEIEQSLKELNQELDTLQVGRIAEALFANACY